MGEAKTPAQTQVVDCKKCGHEFILDDGFQALPVGNDVSQMIVVCPNCDEAKHAYFETPDITAARTRLVAAQNRLNVASAADRDKRWQQYQTQQAVYKRTFDADQVRWRRKRNMPEKV